MAIDEYNNRPVLPLAMREQDRYTLIEQSPPK